LAEYLKLNEKTIIKMAQSGKLPGAKIGNQWRFNFLAIDAYIKGGTIESPGDIASSKFLEVMHDIIPLSRLTGEACIKLNLQSTTRDEVLCELAEVAQKAGIIDPDKNLFEELKDREEMLSTALGNGIAIPHPRHPSSDLFKKSNVIIARSKQGVDFHAPDNKKVHLFFMTCAPNIVAHLKLLAKITKLFRTKNIFQNFMSATSKPSVFRILLEAERINIKPLEEMYA